MPVPFTVLNRLDFSLSRLSVWLGHAVAWGLALMVLITASIVVTRALLGWGSVAMQESVTYLHAMVFMLAAPFALHNQDHVRVDIFYRSFNPLQQAWVNSLGFIVCLLPFYVFTLWVSWPYVEHTWHIKEGSADAGGLPWVYWLKSLIGINGALMLLQGCSDLFRNLITLMYVTEGAQQHV